MKTHMHRLRKKALAFTAIAACSLFYTTSCQKYEAPTAQELENADLIDYALQVIPDIHEVMPHDLIQAMNSIPTGNLLPNGQPEIISALHFGDNPPNLFKIKNDSLLGFSPQGLIVGYSPFGAPKYAYFEVKKYIPCGPAIPSLTEGNYDLRCYNYLFHDQHRGLAESDFKSIYMDEGPDLYLYEIAHTTEPVFIMGDDNLFTAYYFIKTEKKHSAIFNPVDNGPHLAVILSGKISDNGNGIENLYYGYKVLSYDVPPLPPAPDQDPIMANVNDIIVLSPLTNQVPFCYWDPKFSY